MIDLDKKKRPAMDVAADYLAARMRTCSEVRKKLQEKSYNADEIEEAIENLQNLNYLNDYDYAKRYFEYSASKHRGAKRAERELAEKGVDSETIALAYEDYIYESKVDEYEEALEIARSACNGVSEIDEKLIAKVARKLQSRGFKMDDIYKVMSEMRKWNIGG